MFLSRLPVFWLAGFISLVASLLPQTLYVDDPEVIKTVFCGHEEQDSGYIDLPNRVDTHYFYWYFASRGEPSTDPLILWIPGGPGAGGTYGSLVENGPCTVNIDRTTTLNPFSWTAHTNMVWVDTPVNSGFSYSTTIEDDELTDERVADSVYWFLQGFFRKHKELQGRKLFVMGESYAGQFVPSITHYIWIKQGEHLFSPASPESIPIHLEGIAIGNGLTDPVEVFTHFADIADNRYGIELVNDTQLETMKGAVSECRNMMVMCQTNTSVCGEAGDFCQRTQLIPLLQAHRSPYDIRRECMTSMSNTSACMLKTSDVKSFLDLPDVRAFLGVNPSIRDWIPINRTINAAFFSAPSYSGFKSTSSKVSELLEAGLRVLFYAGDADILCNIYAIEATVKKLNWSGAAGFNAAQERPFLTSSGIETIGTLRSHSQLTFVKVQNAGHMAPADQPEVALDMISKFVRGNPI